MKKGNTNNHPVEEDAQETYKWCLHCERTYKSWDHRKVRAPITRIWLEMCPYEDCDGSVCLDGRDWAEVRKGREDRYPEVPVKGEFYALYE